MDRLAIADWDELHRIRTRWPSGEDQLITLAIAPRGD
jgi:hypothetical protein